MEKPTVSILHTSTILPSTPTPPQHLYLSSLDLFWRDIHHNQRILFYESCSLDLFSPCVSALQHSLSLALVHFFPWAGRLVKGPDGRFFVDCNDAGVEFVQASVDVPFSDLGPSFQFKPFFQDLVRWGELERSDSPDIPLLSVQVTKFRNGGIAVGISQNHVIADGHSLWHFMVSWAECARGIPISKPPVHTRIALKLDNPSRAKEAIQIKLANGPTNQENDLKQSVTAERVFYFSGEMIRKLKAKAGEEGSVAYTSFEAYCAHCWKCTTRARMLDPLDEVHFIVLVNCRRKLQPPLPDAYFGNVIHSSMVVTTAGELVRESLGASAARIREGIELCNEETLRAMMHWMELRDNSWGPFRMDSVGVLVASSPRFPVYEVEFGWGKPTAVRPARAGVEGELVLFGDREGRGGMDVCLKLEAKAMEMLEKDSSFLLV